MELDSGANEEQSFYIMKILITTGLSESHIGGPAQYGSNLKNEFEKLGHETRLRQYGSVESALLKIWPDAFWADKILALDTFSVGLPSVIAAKIFGKKVTIRVGGDFLWESYVERTGEQITLPKFNEHMPVLNTKEKIIFFLTKLLVRFVDKLAFNTEWQKDIWKKSYNIQDSKMRVVRNYIPTNNLQSPAMNKIFLWAGRKIKLKNLSLLDKATKWTELEIVSGLSHRKLQEKLKDSYAVIMPSFSEVCPNFVLEAISYGKPFIITRETGLQEIYDKGGIFVDPFNETELKDAILKMSDSVEYAKFKEELAVIATGRPWGEVTHEYLQII